MANLLLSPLPHSNRQQNHRGIAHSRNELPLREFCENSQRKLTHILYTNQQFHDHIQKAGVKKQQPIKQTQNLPKEAKLDIKNRGRTHNLSHQKR
jgi:hypothetical protein